MTTYYVSNAATNGFAIGNDTNNGLTLGAPFLTLDHAIALPPASGDTIVLNSGTYAGNGGATGRTRFQINNAGAAITFQSFTGNAPDVVIQGASAVDYGTIFGVGVQTRGLTFNNVTFTNQAGALTACVRLSCSGADISNLTFNGCKFLVDSTQGAGIFACSSSIGGSNAIHDLAFNNCTVVQNGSTNNARGFSFQRSSATDSIYNLTWQGCYIVLLDACITTAGATNVQVANNVLLSTGAAATNICCQIGYNNTPSASTYNSSGSVINNLLQSVNSHALLLGAGTQTGCQVTGNTVLSGTQGIVIKENNGVGTVSGNRVYSTIPGSINGLYLKAAQNWTFTQNTVLATYGTAIREDAGDTGTKSGNNTITANEVWAAGSGVLGMFTGGSTISLGGTTVNTNKYFVTNGATNTVNGVTGISTFAAAVTAWSTYGLPTNDNLSVYGLGSYVVQAGIRTFQIDPTQSIPTVNNPQTLGDALNAARAQGFGKWVLNVGVSPATITLYAADGTTAVRTFSLNDPVNPSSRS